VCSGVARDFARLGRMLMPVSEHGGDTLAGNAPVRDALKIARLAIHISAAL
jgi:hypothetical protein